MVHLNRVATEREIEESKLVDGVEKIKLAPLDDEPDDFTATVYGSKYAAEDLPRHCMPDREMPPQVFVLPVVPALAAEETHRA